MIKLYNKTRCADEPIRTVLTWASRKLGVRGDTVVKVTASRGWGSSGVAYRVIPFLWHLSKTRVHGARRHGTVGTKPGWVAIRLATLRAYPGDAALVAAKAFMSVALHEMAHIAQYRGGAAFSERRSATGRRPKHDARPIEIDAENRVYTAEKRFNKRDVDRRDMLEFALAVALLEVGDGKGEK